MKIFVPIVIFLVAKANFVDTRQNLLLRKLQYYQETGSSPTWNEMVAKMILNKGNNLEKSVENNNNIWTKFVSQIVLLYKIHIYDKIKNNDVEATDAPPNFDPTVATPDPNDSNDSNSDVDPKSEIELVEPNYHGKIQETSTEVQKFAEESISVTEETECPVGSVKNDKGECMHPTPSKFIIGIPQQCSVGYRRDRLGFCRRVF